MSVLIGAHDWAQSPLGPMADWPPSLRAAVSLMLPAKAQIVLFWGPDFIALYNDAYAPTIGDKHPKALGRPARESWSELWDDLAPLLESVVRTGETVFARDRPFRIERHGYPEEVYFDISYSAVRGEAAAVAGVLCIVSETTERVRAQRALERTQERLSHALGASGMVGTFDWHIGTDTLYADARFAALFSVDPEKGESGAPLSAYLAGIHPDDRDRIAEAVERALATGEKYVQEYRLLQRDGTIRWVEARGECLYDQEGQPLRFPGAVVDITDHKQAEQALRDSEERRRMAAEAAQIGVWDYDPATGTLRWDDQTRALFGLSPDAPVDYDVFLAGLHPDDRDATHAAVQQALDPAGSGEYDIEYRTVGLEDGITRWIAARGKGYFVHGQAVRFIGTVHDITSHKQAEEVERWLAAIIESSDDAIVSKNLDAIITSWNRGAERVFGYQPEEVIGQPITILIPEDRQNEEPRILTRIRRGERVDHFETVRRRKDGSLIEVSLTISPVRDAQGVIVGASKIARDITERRQTEAALRQREQNFRAIFEHANDAIFVIDPKRDTIVQANSRASEMLEYSPEELLRTPVSAIHPDEMATLGQFAELVFDQGSGWTDDLTCRTKSGAIVLAEISASLIDIGGQPHMLAAVRDVTERKRAERLQQTLMHELNHRVKNTLATVQAIARQSFRGGPLDSRARETFEARLHALANAHDLLTRENWDGADMAAVVGAVLAPYQRQRFEIEGPPLRLPPRVALALTLALHELATNAAKYGALSIPAGRVAITWAVEPGDPPHLALRWQERGGPPVAPPAQTGFGSRLIERSLALELAGEVVLTYDPAGVVCEVRAPMPLGWDAEGQGKAA